MVFRMAVLYKRPETMLRLICQTMSERRDENSYAMQDGQSISTVSNASCCAPGSYRNLANSFVSVIANIALLAAKIFAVFFSDSLSLIASAVDSALDLLCTLIIYTTSKLVQHKIHSLHKRFPVGRRRLEPLGILVFSIIMVVSFLQVLQESVKKLLPGSPREAPELPPLAVFAMLSTVSIRIHRRG